MTQMSLWLSHLPYGLNDALDAWLEERCHVLPTQLQLPKFDTHFVVVVLGAPEFDIMTEGVVREPDLGSLVEAIDDVIDIVDVYGILEELCRQRLVVGASGKSRRQTHVGGIYEQQW